MTHSTGELGDYGGAGTRTTGAQTLDRGLRALEPVAATPTGMSVQDVAERLDVHRTIAHLS